VTGIRVKIAPDEGGPRATPLRRYALAAFTVILLGIALTGFFVGWLSSTPSGAVLKESDRPIGFFMLSIGCGVGWLIGTSIVFSFFISPFRLPRIPRVLVNAAMTSPLRGDRSPSWSGLDGPRQPLVDSAPLGALMGVVYPLLIFAALLAPLMFGWLLNGAVYRPVEAVSVLAMVVVCTGWSVFLVVRALTSRVVDRPT
jgi:hypothetical protein